MQDHTAFDCVWEFPKYALPPRNNGSEAVLFTNDLSEGSAPDIFVWQAETPLSTPENIAIYGLPFSGWNLFSAIAHPKSRGQIRLTGTDPHAPLRIESNRLVRPRRPPGRLGLCRALPLNWQLRCDARLRHVRMSGKRRQYTPGVQGAGCRLVIETARSAARVAAEVDVGKQLLGRVRLTLAANNAGNGRLGDQMFHQMEQTLEAPSSAVYS